MVMELIELFERPVAVDEMELCAILEVSMFSDGFAAKVKTFSNSGTVSFCLLEIQKYHLFQTKSTILIQE